MPSLLTCLLNPSMLSLTGNILFSLGLVLQKKFINADNVMTACLYRFLVGFVVFQPIVVWTWKSKSDTAKFEKKYVCYVAIWILSAVVCFYCDQLVLIFIPASTAGAIIDSYAIIVNLVSPIVSDDKFKWSTLFGSVLGVCGIFVMSKPAFLFGDGSQLNVNGILVALLAAFSYAVNCLLSKKILASNLYCLNYVMYVILIATSSFGLIRDQRVFQMDCDVSSILVIGSSVSITIGLLSLNFAYRFGDNGPQALLGLTAVPISFMLEMILTGYQPNRYAVIGAILVVLGVACLLFNKVTSCFLTKVPDDAIVANRFSILKENNNVNTKSSYGSLQEDEIFSN